MTYNGAWIHSPEPGDSLDSELAALQAWKEPIPQRSGANKEQFDFSSGASKIKERVELGFESLEARWAASQATHGYVRAAHGLHTEEQKRTVASGPAHHLHLAGCSCHSKAWL